MAETNVSKEMDNVKITEDIVDPWTVESNSMKGIDYDKLISKFLKNKFRVKYFQYFHFRFSRTIRKL